MKLKWLSIVLLLVLFSSAVVSAQEAADECTLAYLFDGWARASVEGAPNSAAFGLVVNVSGEEDRLVSASSDAAEAVEIHETIMGDGDVMQMRPLADGLPVAANSYAELKPGGLHIMLINLKQPLAAGEVLDLTLNFEKAGEVQLSVPIRDMEAMAMDMGEGMSGDMGMEATAEPMMDMAEMPWDEACQKVFVLDPWVRPAVPGMPNSAAYGLLLNLTAEEETLVGVNTGIAEVAELHEMVMGDGDVMQMRPLEGGIVIPAGGAALLQPGGLHMMLFGLTGELPAGESVDLTLTFANSGEMTITAPVREPEESGMSMGME